MKRLIAALCMLCIAAETYAIKPELHAPIELMSILCNISGYEEYNHGYGREYCDEVTEWFAPYKNHRAVGIMQQLRESNGVGYDAPMSLALYLRLLPDGGVEYAGEEHSLDERFEGVDIEAVTQAVSEFARESRFYEFFEAHRPFYDDICRQFTESVLPRFNEKWYGEFYGTEADETFRIAIGFLNGGNNYGPKRTLPGQKSEVFAIMGYVKRTSDGRTSYVAQPDIYLNILVHEFNHSFINHLIGEGSELREKMRHAGEGLFDLCSQIMGWQAYDNWATVINESLVRAAVICYLIDNGAPAESVREAVMDEIRVGFVWTPELVGKLRQYQRQRDLYPTFESYYPQIIDLFESYVAARRTAIDAAVM